MTKYTCNFCIYCEYRANKYHCLHGGEDYFVGRTDPACEDFIISALPALHDKNRATPRVMGMQWNPNPETITKPTKKEAL